MMIIFYFEMLGELNFSGTAPRSMEEQNSRFDEKNEAWKSRFSSI